MQGQAAADTLCPGFVHSVPLQTAQQALLPFDVSVECSSLSILVRRHHRLVWLQCAAVFGANMQLFNAADPAAADLDDTPDHMGEDLMASRHEAWEELCVSKVSQHTCTPSLLHIHCIVLQDTRWDVPWLCLCDEMGCEGLLHGVGTQNSPCMVAYALVTLLYVAHTG